MLAIFKREFLQYFKSPVGFVAFGLFAFLSGFLLVQSLSNQAVSISSEIISLRSFFVILVPIVTMGLLADDKKRGTDIIYYTSPISLLSVVIGKFLAALCLFGVMFLNVIIHIFVTLGFGGHVDSGVLGSAIVYFTLAALFVAMGLFASSITENQIISAIVCFILILAVQLLSAIGSFASTAVVKVMNVFGNPSSTTQQNVTNNIIKAFSWLDPFQRTESFRSGLFSFVALFYCLSFAAFFLFLSYRILEKKRWSQS